jgi:triosephosphate isomerase
MADRKPIVGGNWKMNLDLASARELAAGVADLCGAQTAHCDVVVYPAFVHLAEVRAALDGSSVRLGAQDVYHEPNGAFTGEISIDMLKDIGVGTALVGHSERRHVIGEDDDLVNRKLRAALEAGLNVTLCIGETEEQREAGQTETVNLDQLRKGLAWINDDHLDRIVLAYEPVWAIGTGKTATPDDAEAVHAVIRGELEGMFSPDRAHAMRIQYGGSVKPNNATELIAQPNIDGFLVGGASLKVADFADIVSAVAQAEVRAQ